MSESRERSAFDGGGPGDGPFVLEKMFMPGTPKTVRRYSIEGLAAATKIEGLTEVEARLIHQVMKDSMSGKLPQERPEPVA